MIAYYLGNLSAALVAVALLVATLRVTRRAANPAGTVGQD
jgi:hypothetical protein